MISPQVPSENNDFLHFSKEDLFPNDNRKLINSGDVLQGLKAFLYAPCKFNLILYCINTNRKMAAFCLRVSGLTYWIRRDYFILLVFFNYNCYLFN